MDEWPTKEIDEGTLLAHLERRLVAEFGDRLSLDEIHRTVEAVAGTWVDARVRHYIPILTERAARQRLAAAARASSRLVTSG